jgi:hypothetical protein
MEILNETPELHKLRKVLQREVMLQVNFMHPSIIVQSLRHFPIFTLGGGID